MIRGRRRRGRRWKDLPTTSLAGRPRTGAVPPGSMRSGSEVVGVDLKGGREAYGGGVSR